MPASALVQEALTRSIIGAFFEVYNNLGFGFLEYLYGLALERELSARGHQVVREYCVDVTYKGQVINRHRLDLVVDDCVVVEIKSTRLLADEASRQLLNYLRCTDFEVGLLLHYGPKAHIQRVILENAFKPQHRHPR